MILGIVKPHITKLEGMWIVIDDYSAYQTDSIVKAFNFAKRLVEVDILQELKITEQQLH
tara:strand:- start:2980 stop:3156 length:177 start_codon:yes stop_codon:yes gene_type:complete